MSTGNGGAEGRLPVLPAVIGHRGAALSAPENTLAGMRMAQTLGARWVEFDVHLSGDGRCILMHDDTVNRTTDGKGMASRTAFDTLRRYDAGRWFGEQFAGERIPAFEEVIDLLGELGLGANVEIKPAPGQAAATARAAVELLQRRWPAHLPPPLISSFEPESLAVAQQVAPDIARGHLFGRLPADWRAQAERLGCVTIHCDQRHLRRPAAEAIIAAGYPLLAYTVNQPERATELISWGLAAVFSDCPDRILAALDAAKKRSPSGIGIHT
jgi:glycerophosphoryl diester phosphodiesterase